jgi:PAS domain S-box-containing protein
VSLSFEQLDKLTAAIPGVVFQFLVDPDGRWTFTYLSQGIRSLFGVSPEEAYADHNAMTECILPEYRESHRAAVERSVRTLTVWMHEHQIQAVGGRLKWVRGQANPEAQPDGSVLWNGILTDITERKNVEASLQANEEKYRFLLDHSSDPIFSLSAEGVYGFANKSFADGVGKRVDQIIGKHISDIFPEEEAKSRQASVNWVVENKVGKVIEVRVPNPDGDRWYVTHVTPTLDDHGQVKTVVCASKDITDRKHAENVLKASEEKYRALVETTDTGYLIIDRSGKVLDANQEYLRLSGYRELREILGRPVTDWTADYEIEKNLKAIGQCAKDGFIRNFVIDYVDGNGKIMPVEVNATVVGDGDSLRIIALCRDVTERERQRKHDELQRTARLSDRLSKAEAELFESEQRLALAAESVGLGFWIHDFEKDEIWSSERLRDLFGFSRSERIDGSKLQARLRPADRTELSNQLFLAQGEAGNFETELRIDLPDGGVRWITMFGRGEFDAGGRPIRTRGIALDSTQRKLDELKLEEKRMEVAHLSRVGTLGELSGALAHELNQPLTAILSNAQAAQRFLARDRPDIDEVRAILQDIVDEDRRAGDIIARLRRLFGKGLAQRQSYDARELVTEVMQILHNEMISRGVRLHADLPGACPNICTDRVQFQQVLINLVTNACDAMAAVADSERMVLVRAAPASDQAIQVSVIDRGTGVGDNLLQNTFVPFYTTKEHGMGLGLSICQTIVDANGGRLWCENNQDRGASFHFSVPTAASETP